LEPLAYSDAIADEKSLEFARVKPQKVQRYMAEFSLPQYGVDVLKVEVPINAVYVEGSTAYKGQKAYTRQEALEHFRNAASAAKKPFIYLSAGVSNPVFIENLSMAAESGTDYSGVLCGRATWADGVPIYGKQGAKALEDWLSTEGVKNINSVNAAITSAKPWYLKAGLSQSALA
ncbi:MAG TPA: tagatose 1,6-diphosphate aldolase, partial [Bryobacteraceae bacterium]